MVIDGQQEGLLLRGLPPLVDGGIVLPEFVEAGAFPSAASFGASFREADEVGKVRLDKSGDGFAVALEAEADFQFIGGQLKVGRFLKRHKILEELGGFWRPIRAVISAGELGAELRTEPEPTGAEPVKVSAADLEVVGGIRAVDATLVELGEDLEEERGGEAFCQLLFFMFQNDPEPPLGRGASSASATLRSPQPLDPGVVPIGKRPVSF